MKKMILCGALMALAATASAQVDYGQRDYRVVLDQATVNTLTGSPTPNALRFAVAVDQSNNQLYTIAQQPATPFQDFLISTNLSTLSSVALGGILDNDPALAGTSSFMNLTSRAFVFEGGRLLAASQSNGNTTSGLYELNTATGALTAHIAPGTDATPIVGIVNLGGNQYAIQEGSFNGGAGELRLVTLTGSAVTPGASIETTANAQGLTRDAAGNLYVVAQTGTGAATIKKISDVTTTPVISDITPTAAAWTGENMSNTRNIYYANGDLFVWKRGTTTETDGRLYIIEGATAGGNITTITSGDILAGLQAEPGYNGATLDIQDTHGLAVVPVSAAQTRVYFGARSVTGGWSVLELTLGGATAVEEWMSY